MSASGAMSAVTDSTTLLLANPSGSGRVLHVVALRACNIARTNTEITVTFLPASDTGVGTGYCIAHRAKVIGNGYVNIIDLQSSIYMQENTSIAVRARDSNYLDIVYSYEDVV
jgi:hypothetical protein